MLKSRASVNDNLKKRLSFRVTGFSRQKFFFTAKKPLRGDELD